MNESLDELNEIKKEIVKKAIYHYKIGNLKKDIDNLNFDNKRHIQIILRKYRTFENIIDPTKKGLLNQMITNAKQIPNVMQIPNVIIETIYYPTNIIMGSKHKQKDKFSELNRDDPFEGDDYTPIMKKIIIEEPIIEERPTYYCNDCNHNHFYDSNIGKEHTPINKIEKIKEIEEIEKTLEPKETEETKEISIELLTVDELIKIAYEKTEIAIEFIKKIENNLKNKNKKKWKQK